MSIEKLNKCNLCTRYISSTKEGRAAHMRKDHGVIVRNAAPLSAEKKAEVVARMEVRLGLEHFIFLSPPVFYAHTCNKCGPTNAEGYWLMDKTGICEPCIKQGPAGVVEVDSIEEIQYHD